MHKQFKRLIPNGLLWRLTSVNLLVIVLAITLMGWAVYETACTLTAGIGNFEEQRQQQFNATLLQYVVIFMIMVTVVGIALHVYFTRKIIHPIKQVINSTKQMKQGKYPARLKMRAEGELEDLVTQFNSLIDRLEKNELERKKLVTDLSHEIRTPLSNISGYLQALQSGVIEADEQLYSSLLQEAKRLGDMVNQLDQLKGWDQRQIFTETDKEHADISLLIDQCVGMFQWKLDKQGINIHLQVENEQLTINRNGIEQVVSNILDNAVQYYNGDGDIYIKGAKQSDGQFYKVSITGPSQQISEDEASQIFNRLYRVDSSRSRETGGTGLGLAIAREIIEFHQGEIGITSNGLDNTVWFTIPY